MAQFDVYKNPSKNTRAMFPYILDIQNSVISEIATRIVIPLGRLEYFKNEKMNRLTPEVLYEGERFLLLTPQIASVPKKVLRDPIGSLNHMRQDIIDSLDFATTGI